MISFKKNGEEVTSYFPEYTGKSIVIAIDASKSNTAMVVGDPQGNVYDDYEISGSSESVNVYDLCKETRKQLHELFTGANILYVGIEDIITKKTRYKDKYGNTIVNTGGMEYHQSRYKITAVFDNFMFLFDDYFNVRPHPINNNLWKTATLPEEYRKRSVHKGSKQFFKDMGSDYGNRKDDVTDALLLYKYIIENEQFRHVLPINRTVPTKKKFDYIIQPSNFVVPYGTEFEINNSDELLLNVMTVAEQIEEGQFGWFLWPLSRLSLEEIYSDKLLPPQGMGAYTRLDKDVKIVVAL